MARTVRPLTETLIKRAKIKDRMYYLRDGNGLMVQVNKSGSKIFILEYINPKTNKRTMKTLGRFPMLSLREARIKADEFKYDVMYNKNYDKTFGDVAKLYLKKLEKEKSCNYVKSENARLKHLFDVYETPLNDINKRVFIDIAKNIQEKGKLEQGHRVFALAKRILDFAVANDYMETNPLYGVPKHLILQKPKAKNYSHIQNEKEFAKLLIDIDEYFGNVTVKLALKLLAHTFVRPSNVRFMEWEEIDFENALWKIPAEKMKMNKEHIVPLTKQTLSILKDAYAFRTSKIYVFPHATNNTRPMSENTLNQALMRLGYKGVMTAHGFRHSASTLLHENMHIHNIPSEIIELQLAHTDKNTIRAVYNKAIYKEQREKLMQWWSDYLDEIKHKESIDRYRR